MTEFYADRQAFAKAINEAKGFAYAEKAIGSDDFKVITIIADLGTVRLIACNGEAFCSIVCPAQIVSPGRFSVTPGTLLADVRSMSEQTVKVSTTDTKMRVTSGRDVCTTVLLPLVDHGASLPVMPADAGFVVAAHLLRAALNASAYAIATETVRYGLNGLHVEICTAGKCKDELRFVATDGYRLACAHAPYRGDFTFPAQTLIPRQACNGLASLAGEARIFADNGWILASYGDNRFGWRLLVGEFPEYQQIVPTDTRHSFKARKADLLHALSGARALGTAVNDKGERVSRASEFIIHDGSVRIKSGASERTTEREVAATTSGDLVVGFNADYLHEAVSAIESDSVEIRLLHPLAPAIVEPDDAGGSFGVVMPMRID